MVEHADAPEATHGDVDQAAAIEAASSLARLTAEISGLQRQIDHLEQALVRSLVQVTELTDAKFVTFRTLIDSNESQVKLALDATSKAIDKAEVATQKAIEKESENNNDRFAKVNEFRAQQTELIGRFATLERVDLLYNQTRQRVDEVSNNLGDRITSLDLRIKAIEEYARGAQGNRNGLYAAIAAAVGLIAIFVFLANVLTK